MEIIAVLLFGVGVFLLEPLVRLPKELHTSQAAADYIARVRANK